MPINKVRRKIHHLRRQPDHVRLRAASYVTIIGGICLTLLWVTVLLPLQLRLSGGLRQDNAQRQVSQPVANQNNDELSPRVGGVRDESTASQPLFYTAAPQVDSQGTVVNSSANETNAASPSNEEYQANNNQQSSSDPDTFDTVPVEVTE